MPIDAKRSTLAITSSGVPARPLERSSSTSRPMAPARRAISGSSRPTQSTWAAERSTVAGSRSWARHTSSTPRLSATTVSASAKGTLYSSANRATRAGVRRAPKPPTMIGGRGRCTGLGNAGLPAIW